MKPPRVVRWILFVAVLALLPLLPSRAICAEEVTAPDALAPGSWSVQFSVQPNFTLGTYSGSTLSLKKHLGSGNALRMGLSVNVSNLADDDRNVTSDTTAIRTQASALDGNVWSVGANVLYLWYAHNAAPIHAYWGAGPSFSITHGHDENVQTLVNTPPGGPVFTLKSSNDGKTDGWSAGLGAVMGVEWLVARRVGLIAEYGTSFGYGHSTSERTVTQDLSGSSTPTTFASEHDSDRWDFSGSGGRLGVSVYF